MGKLRKKLNNYIRQLEDEMAECDKWDTEEMRAESYVYDLVISDLKMILESTSKDVAL